METWTGSVALVTGASVGIGAAIARLLVENGMTVIGCARNVSKIDALSQELSGAPGKLVARKCDVRKEEEVKQVFQYARTEFGGVDVCVNNAGLAHVTPILESTTEELRDMLEVNVLALCICSREFMAQIKERGVDRGHIININSTAGHKISKLHFYSATKYAVGAITEGIRQELREMKSNVRVSSISPGLVRTEFYGRSRKWDDIEASKVAIDRLTSYGTVLEADDVASAVKFVLSAPPRMEVNDVLVRPIGQIF